MNTKIILIVCAIFVSQSLFSSETDSLLFNFGSNNVSVSEFLKVYKKSNQKKEDAFTDSSLTEYLDLYINFKLKVQEALDTKFDTMPSVKAEINKYRKQLAKAHIQDNNIYESLIREAYERKKTIREVSHILIKVGENAKGEDTLAAFEKISSIYNSVVSGEDFKTSAIENSEDPSVKRNSGFLGPIQVLNFVYPFESMAYKTNIGQASKPFRTKFGYHILKVHNESSNAGSLLTAHVFIQSSDSDDEQKKLAQKAKANDTYQLIRSGTLSFEEAVQKFSDDKQSKKNNGKIRWFSKGEMVPEYQDAAYEIINIGELSVPTKSPYGWHIIKLLDKKPLGSFENERAAIKQKIVRSARKKIAEDLLIKQIKRENNFSFNQKSFDKIVKKTDDGILNNTFEGKSLKGKWSKVIFSLGNRVFLQSEFIEYVQKFQKTKKGDTKEVILKGLFDQFVRLECTKYEEKTLIKKDPEFASLMQEYHDGILLFEIMDKKVWSKAVSDTSGLKAFYEDNNNNYMWGERIHTKIYNCNSKMLASKLISHLNSKPKVADSSVFNMFNKPDVNDKLFIEELKLEKKDNETVDATNWVTGLHLKEGEEGEYLVIKNMLIISPEPKALKETKGLVIADYQNTLEKDWIRALKKKYPININTPMLKSLVR